MADNSIDLESGRPYLDFVYNGHLSSEFNIIRTSTSNRYIEDIQPAGKDITVEVEGRPGKYYYGTTYAKRTWTIPFAFDNLTPSKYKEMQIWLGDGGIHPFWLSEWPNRLDRRWYPVKVSGTATIKFLSFKEGNEEVYKGEGSIQFTCLASDEQISAAVNPRNTQSS